MFLVRLQIIFCEVAKVDRLLLAIEDDLLHFRSAVDRELDDDPFREFEEPIIDGELERVAAASELRLEVQRGAADGHERVEGLGVAAHDDRVQRAQAVALEGDRVGVRAAILEQGLDEVGVALAAGEVEDGLAVVVGGVDLEEAPARLDHGEGLVQEAKTLGEVDRGRVRLQLPRVDVGAELEQLHAERGHVALGCEVQRRALGAVVRRRRVEVEHCRAAMQGGGIDEALAVLGDALRFEEMRREFGFSVLEKEERRAFVVAGDGGEQRVDAGDGVLQALLEPVFDEVAVAFGRYVVLDVDRDDGWFRLGILVIISFTF